MPDQATQLRRMIEAQEGTPGSAGVASTAVAVPSSVSAGRVSYAPRHVPPVNGSSHAPPSRPPTIRPHSIEEVKPPPPGSRLPVAATVVPAPPRRIARAIAVTSGKGGVGKSNLAVNLSIAMAAQGRRVCLIDGDLGLANADVLCSVTPRYTLDDVVHGRCRLADAIVPAPGAFQLLPGASGVTRMADLPAHRQQDLLERLSILERSVDLMVIDTGAGIHRNVLTFASAAHTVLIAVTPEPTSITDGYGLVKALVRRSPDARLEVIVNMCRNAREADAVFERMNRVSKAFLNVPLCFGGWVPDDQSVRDAVLQRLPFTLLYPRCPASRKVMALGKRLATIYDEPEPAAGGSNGFFARLLRRIAGNRREAQVFPQ